MLDHTNQRHYQEQIITILLLRYRTATPQQLHYDTDR